MDLATIVGLAAGIAMIFAVILREGNLAAYLNPHALLLVGGGVTATAFIMFDMKTVLGSIRVAVKAFRDDTWNLQDIIDQMVRLSKQARTNGILSLEGLERGLRNPFLRKGIQLAVDGNEEGMIRFIMATDVGFTRERHALGQKVFRQMGAMAPAFGMIGTLIGLVDMLRNIDDPSEIGAAMSVALVCTLYGAVLANLVFLPIANKLEFRTKEEALAKQVITEGIVSIMQGNNPKVLKEKLEAFVPPAMRKGWLPEPKSAPAAPAAEEAA
jgi:chemotaxis protein MotA